MGNPANRTQHKSGPNNARRTGSTLPETENTMRTGAQQSRGNTVARWGNIRANDLNAHPVPYNCVVCQKRFDKLKDICSHMRKHRYRPWRGLTLPSSVVRFDLNEHPEDGGREIWVDGWNCRFWVTILRFGLSNYVMCMCFFLFFQISILCVVKSLTIQSCCLLLYQESYRLSRSFFIIEFLS